MSVPIWSAICKVVQTVLSHHLLCNTNDIVEMLCHLVLVCILLNHLRTGSPCTTNRLAAHGTHHDQVESGRFNNMLPYSMHSLSTLHNSKHNEAKLELQVEICILFSEIAPSSRSTGIHIPNVHILYIYIYCTNGTGCSIYPIYSQML